MRRDTTIINPRQLYIELGVDELKKLNCPQLGISHFYEFSLGQGKTHELKAVPDGSIDLLFNIGSDKVTTYISGRALIAFKLILYRQRRPPSLKIFLTQIGIQPAYIRKCKGVPYE